VRLQIELGGHAKEKAGAIEVEVGREKTQRLVPGDDGAGEVRRNWMLATLGCSRFAGATAFVGKPPGGSQIWY